MSLGRGLSHCHASFLAPFEFQFTSKREFVKLLKVSLAIKDIVIVVVTKKEKKCVKSYNRNASFDMSLFSKSTLSLVFKSEISKGWIIRISVQAD